MYKSNNVKNLIIITIVHDNNAPVSVSVTDAVEVGDSDSHVVGELTISAVTVAPRALHYFYFLLLIKNTNLQEL